MNVLHACLLNEETSIKPMEPLHSFDGKFPKILLPPDSLWVDQAYQDFRDVIDLAAKRFITCGRRSKHIPSGDTAYEN